MEKRFLLFFVCCVLTTFGFTQDFSNKGKDFWVGYGYHQVMVSGNQQEMVLYFTSDVTANVTVEIPALGWAQTYTVNANTVVESANMPKIGSQDSRLTSEGVFSTGIHITSDKPIVAYAHIYNSSVSGATLLFPTNTLGQDYYTLGFTQVSNSPNANSWAYVIATEDNTLVEITPSAATLNHAANVPFTVTLNKGQIFNLMGVLTSNLNPYRGVDLTGTRIRSVSSGTSSCKRIAVFSGSGRVSITCTPNVSSSSSDNLIQQVFPKSAWGKKFLTVPTVNLPNNHFRIAVSDPLAVVTVDGVPITGIINNFYYELSLVNTPKVIESTQPIMVAQYIASTGSCNNNFSSNGDPEMIYLSPVEQTINDITLNSTAHYLISSHYINVVIKNSGINSFKLDNFPRISNFVPHPSDKNYSYATFFVSAGAHNLNSDSGFNAIAYGYGNAESYGYNAGTNIKDLYQFISLQNQFATVNFPATCKNTPFRFFITLPYQPTSLVWDFSNSPNLSPNALVTDNAPVADSVYLRDGKTLRRFSLPGFYSFSSAGTYPIKVIANNPSSDGCPGVQEIAYDVEVFEKPATSFTVTHSGCLSDTALFIDATQVTARPNVRWNWDFGDATTDTVRNPHKAYLTSGTFNVKLTSVNDIGCVGDTTKPITITNPPLAKFGVSDTTCIGNTITFTDSSSVPAGTISRWVWNFGNGNTLTNTTNSPVTATYNSTGTYTVSLTVEASSGCKSLAFSRIISVHAKPVVDFTMPGVCLPSGFAQFTNLTTISDSIARGITFLWSFGDGGTDTARNPSHVYTTAGPFNVTLLATSLFGCSEDSLKNFTNIFVQPTANFTAPAGTCLSDSIQFNDASTAASSSVSQWFWSFGDGTLSNLRTPKKKYGAPGTYTVKLYIRSVDGCFSDTATKSVLVGVPPLAKAGISAPGCANQPVTFFDSSGTTDGNLVKWYWSFGDGFYTTETSANPITHIYTAPGTYLVTLVVESNSGCKSDTLKRNLAIGAVPFTNFTFPADICLSPGIVQFTNLSTFNGSPSGMTYSWNFGDGAGAVSQNPSHQYLTAGPFNVKLVTSAVSGCIKDTTKELNAILPKPIANFIVSAEACVGDSTNFTDQSNGAGSPVVKWRWDFGDGGKDTTRSPKHKYTASGTFMVTLVVFTDKGCISDTVAKSTVVLKLPEARFGTSVPSCVRSAITFNDSSLVQTGYISEWNWSFGDATTAANNTPGALAGFLPPFPKTYNSTGNYLVKLSVKSNKGCRSDTASKLLTISSLPVANFILPRVCLNDAFAQFTDSSYIEDGTQSGFTYVWDFGDPNATAANPNTSTQRNPAHKYTSAGTYTAGLTVISAKGCTSFIAKQFVVSGSFPQANLAVVNPNALCGNELVSFQNTSTISPGSINKLEITWDLAGSPAAIETDSNPVFNKIYNHRYPALQTTANYQIKLKVFSGGSCTGEKIITITVNATPKATFTTVPGICLDADPRQIVQASSGGVTGTAFYTGTGVSSTGLFRPALSGAGLFPIKYLFTSDAGCKDSASQQITVWTSPVAKWNIDLPSCEGASVTFRDSSAAGFGKINTWRWDFGNGFLASYQSGNPFSRTYSASGNYSANLLVITDSGCRSLPVAKTIVIHPLPIVNFILPGGVCLPDGRAQFTDSSFIADGSQSRFNYLWQFGDPANALTSPQKNPVHRYSTSGPFDVKLTVTSGDGCSSSLTKQLSGILPQPKANFNVAPAVICIGSPMAFNDQSNGIGSNIAAWNWNFGDGTTSTAQNISKLYTIDGTFKVSLFIINQQGCLSDTLTKTVSVYPAVVVNAGADLTVLEGGSVMLNPIITGSRLSYKWTPADYLSSDIVQKPVSSPVADISYKIIATSEGGCSGSDEVVVRVKAPAIPNAFSPNNDGINDTWVIQYLESYPGATVEIFNRYGQVVYTTSGYNRPWDGTFKGQVVPAGVYYYIINPKNGRKQFSGSVTVLR